VNTGDHSVSSVKLVLTAQEFITEYSKALYFVGVFHGNILAYDPNPATGQLKIAGFLHWRQRW
jgi:hypothetical protein